MRPYSIVVYIVGTYVISFRLIVALAVVVFYVSAVFPYTGGGPLWNRAKAAETDTCRQNWWLNLLMVNNYIDTEHIVSTIWIHFLGFPRYVFSLIL